MFKMFDRLNTYLGGMGDGFLHMLGAIVVTFLAGPIANWALWFVREWYQHKSLHITVTKPHVLWEWGAPTVVGALFWFLGVPSLWSLLH